MRGKRRGRKRFLTALGVGWVFGFAIASMSSPVSAVAPCSDSENWTGTSGPNTRYDDGDGDFEKNNWFFLDGNDFGRSLDCADEDLIGDMGADDLGGGSHGDRVEGESGFDDIFGGAGDDLLGGGPNGDSLEDNQGSDVDVVFAEDGDDNIDVEDGDQTDLASGGAGDDDCRVDHTSEATSCQTQ